MHFLMYYPIENGFKTCGYGSKGVSLCDSYSTIKETQPVPDGLTTQLPPSMPIFGIASDGPPAPTFSPAPVKRAPSKKGPHSFVTTSAAAVAGVVGLGVAGAYFKSSQPGQVGHVPRAGDEGKPTAGGDLDDPFESASGDIPMSEEL